MAGFFNNNKQPNYLYIVDKDGNKKRVDMSKPTNKDTFLATEAVRNGVATQITEDEWSGKAPIKDKAAAGRVNANQKKAEESQSQPKQSFLEKEAEPFKKATKEGSVKASVPSSETITPKTETEVETSKTEETETKIPEVNADIPSEDDIAGAQVELGIESTDDVDTAKTKLEKEMVSSGMFSIDKNGKIVPNKMSVPSNNWKNIASAASIVLSVLGAAAGVPIPPLNFNRIFVESDATRSAREGQQAAYNKVQQGLADQYNKLVNIESSGNVAPEAAERAGYVNAAVQGGKAMSDWSTDSALQMAKFNLDSQLKTMKVSNELQKDLMKEIAKVDVQKQADIMDAVATWMQKNPSKAATYNASQIVNAVLGFMK